MGSMTAQLHNRFVFCVVVVEFAVNENQALQANDLHIFLPGIQVQHLIVENIISDWRY